MTPNLLIPTIYKQPLSDRFSYPVGSQVLSEHLVGVPQFSELTIHFARCPFAFASEFEQILARAAEYHIVDARWSRGATSIYSWSIGIFPVLRESKQAARGALISLGLPLLRCWLNAHHNPNTSGPNYCRIIFAPDVKKVYLREPKSGYEQRTVAATSESGA